MLVIVTDLVTTDPAHTMVPSAISTHGKITEFAQIQTSFQIFTSFSSQMLSKSLSDILVEWFVEVTTTHGQINIQSQNSILLFLPARIEQNLFIKISQLK